MRNADPESMETEAAEAAGSAPRFRLRNGAGAASGGRGKRKKPSGKSSDNEEAADEESLAVWLEELTQKADGDVRRAFSLKPCTPKEIRQLPDSSFLGGQRKPGALPIYDLEGKVSLQFLLATYKASEKSRQRGDSDVEFHRPFLRWLLKKARELQLLSSREVKRGALASGRLQSAQRSGEWSLSLEQNQAEASDEETRQKRALERESQSLQSSGSLEVRFPERKLSAEGSDQSDRAALLKQQWRHQLESKEERIEAKSSHGLDLQTMCDRLTAPSLSFDWHEPDSDEEDSSKGILQVEVPESALKPEGRRALLREEIQRSVSFKQAKELAKAQSLPSSGDTVRAAATPTKAKKRKVVAATNEEKSEEILAPKSQKELMELPREPNETTKEACPEPKESSVARDMAQLKPEAEGVEPQEGSQPPPAASVEAVSKSTSREGGSEELFDENSQRGCVADPFALEISPTLPFEVPADDESREKDLGCDISPTLPFDIDASPFQKFEEAAEAAAAPSAPAAAAAPVEEEDEADIPSSEDEELKANPRFLRERAWLRHKRQMQAASTSQEALSQEDFTSSLFARPRAKSSRATEAKAFGGKKRSILMGAVAACG